MRHCCRLLSSDPSLFPPPLRETEAMEVIRAFHTLQRKVPVWVRKISMYIHTPPLDELCFQILLSIIGG